MKEEKNKKQKNKKRRNKKRRNKNLIIILSALFAMILALVLVAAVIIILKSPEEDYSALEVSQNSQTSSFAEASSQQQSGALVAAPAESQVVQVDGETLDAEYEKLILVNARNPLPEDFDYTGNLTTIDSKYINGNLNKMDKDVYPYAKAMVEAAWKDGVKLYIRSPYRSYGDQKVLYENKIKRLIESGVSKEIAPDEAAMVVARPGTSEHHTGLAIDFNFVEREFEETKMFDWLKENAEDYGFILRYPEDKLYDIGVIYEPWHWRFVGINKAKEINRLGVTLEEYLETKE